MSEVADVPAEAKAVLQKFWEAGLRQDEKTMRACLTRKTLESDQFDPSSSPQGARFMFKESHMEGDQAVILVRALPQDAQDDAPSLMDMPCIMVQEDGEWKLDLVATIDRLMGGFEAALGQAAGAIGSAMEGIGHAVGDALGQAFGSPAAQPPQDEVKPKPRKKKPRK